MPGQRLTESELVGQLGVSKTPVREALLMLQADGLVTLIPHLGASVTYMTLAEYEQLVFARDALEFPLLERSVSNATSADISEARAALAEMDHTMAAGDFKNNRRALRRLHVAQLSSSGLPMVVRIVIDLFRLTHRVGRFCIAPRPDVWAKELRAMKERQSLLERGDSESACRFTLEWHREFAAHVRRLILERDPLTLALFLPRDPEDTSDRLMPDTGDLILNYRPFRLFGAS